MSRLTQATPGETPYTLNLTWDDGQEQTADLSGLVSLSRHFATFSENPDAFAKVKVINWGHGVGWENGMDYSAENLARIANEQMDEDGPELIRDFQKRFHLTNEQTAKALGYKISQIKNLKAGTSPINGAVRVAIHAMQSNPTVLYARMR